MEAIFRGFSVAIMPAKKIYNQPFCTAKWEKERKKKFFEEKSSEKFGRLK